MRGAHPTTVAVIGAGRVGTAFAVLLERAGYRVTAAAGREATRERVRRYLAFTRFYPPELAHEAAGQANVVILGVPDDAITDECGDLAGRNAFRRGHFVLHLSGSVGLDALQPAGLLGAHVLSLHPLQTFPDVAEGIRRLPGSGIAVTAADEQGERAGWALATDVGGHPFPLSDDMKPLYHAAAVFCSNYLVAVEGMAEHLFRLAGLEDPGPLFAPLARASLDATIARGAEAALTGPAVRGEAGTIQRNLQALSERAPEAVAPYVALARMAAGLASASGRLSPENARRLEGVLDGWR